MDTHTAHTNYTYTVVWKKFTVGYFHMKMVHDKTFSSLEISDENF